METIRKPQQRTIETKSRLIKAAFELFNEKGYYKTNSKEIAARAGVSIGNFYNYFSDKGEVYCLILEEHFRISEETMTSMMDACLKIEDKGEIRELLRRTMAGMLDRSAHNKFLNDISVIARENKDVRVQSLDGVNKLIAVVERFLIKKRSKGNCYLKARMIYVLTENVATDIITIQDRKQKEEYLELFCDEIMHHIYDMM